MKRLLVVGYVWPEPNSSAAGSHMMNLLHGFLQQGYSITFASAAQLSEHRFDLTTLGIKEKEIILNCDSFNHFLTALDPDVVLFDRFMLEEQFAWRVQQHCPQALRILDTEDLHFLRLAREHAHKKNIHIDAALLQSDTAKREVAAIYRSDLTLIISPYEYQLLVEEFGVPESLLLHIPLMAEKTSELSVPAFNQRQHFISIGNFRHAPNWDAVRFLKESIWLKIRQALPQAELHIYGAYPPPKATQLHNEKQGFLVKGWAESAHSVMSGAKVCLAPLRFGAGLKGKLVDAMQCGTPSVTTSIGSEGMAQSQWNGEIKDSVEDFVQSAISLYMNESLWHEKQAIGFNLLQQFDRDKHLTRLMDRVSELREALPHHRQQNFIGQILQHQSHHATKYMSQWIEAKNK